MATLNSQHSTHREQLNDVRSIQAIRGFESLTAVSRYPAASVLIREEQEPSTVMFVLEGRVKLSINSSDGRRLIVGIALAGEILGLTSALSGCSHVITAEAQFPCVIASLQLQAFLGFLMCYPAACWNVMGELSLDYNRAAQQLRILGLTQTARAKPAKLYLGWSKDGEQTRRGVRIQCALSHVEIGEQIGVSRETISRTMKDFRSRGLVEQRGATLIVKNREALEVYRERYVKCRCSGLACRLQADRTRKACLPLLTPARSASLAPRPACVRLGSPIMPGAPTLQATRATGPH
jgi:CRP/FNR family transcriptional regulator